MNCSRLPAVKDQYDPDGLFFVHHGVGSERWSADGYETWIRPMPVEQLHAHRSKCPAFPF
ncbi:BBE domain-containing protein [Burkholderia sp. S171]|uniref:BBE domain-containing protein n=1 Tax=Burkholderia sp. S171 TaxID=1641860 RepID=UPI00131CF2ED|nr:BBE domain-containing protein [Burkholderia sp. S171]